MTLFNGPNNRQNCPFPWAIWTPSWTQASYTPKRHLDPITRFCRARKRDQQTDTDTQADHATPTVAIGRIYSHCCGAA